MASRKKSPAQPAIRGILGLGLDQKREDGEKRITQSENFLLVGGSEETHERMADTAMRFDERLRDKGKRLQDASPEEVRDLLRDSMR
jgi:hypothetical protein